MKQTYFVVIDLIMQSYPSSVYIDTDTALTAALLLLLEQGGRYG